MRDNPRPKELYRHFKGNLYQIVTLDTDSETRQDLVVYQALYGDYRVYVRPLDMFMSEVDRRKYPDAAQNMRFERVLPESLPEDKKTPDAHRDVDIKEKRSDSGLNLNIIRPQSEITKPVVDEKSGYKRPEPVQPKKSSYMSKTVDEEAEELGMDPLVIKFMDADLASEKNAILSRLRPTITNDMIDIMAMSLGVVVGEGDVYDRYNDLRNCLNAIEKFESTRLRS